MRHVRSVIVLLVLFAIAAGLQWMNRRSPHVPVAPERVDEIFTVCGIGSSLTHTPIRSSVKPSGGSFSSANAWW